MSSYFLMERAEVSVAVIWAAKSCWETLAGKLRSVTGMFSVPLLLGEFGALLLTPSATKSFPYTGSFMVL